ncbi:hypothetical protein ACFQZV_10015 [Microbacterium koreense]|uniref:Uncharacterized protein n=1 Tax=Microbacterium koreense TaxID=323761 RepID=A0ABW2ZSW8_9MICO
MDAPSARPTLQEAAPTRHRLRAILCWILAAIVVSCLVIVMVAVPLMNPSMHVLIGSVSGAQIGCIAMMIGVVAFTSLAFLLLPVKDIWLVLKIPLAVVAGLVLVIIIALLPLLSDTKVTPLRLDGCESGYVAIEPVGGGGSFIGVRNGITVTQVAVIAGNDFDRPFAAGDFEVEARGSDIEVSYVGVPNGAAVELPLVEEYPCSNQPQIGD